MHRDNGLRIDPAAHVKCLGTSDSEKTSDRYHQKITAFDLFCLFSGQITADITHMNYGLTAGPYDRDIILTALCSADIIMVCPYE